MFSAEEIARRVRDLGRQIERDYEGKELILLGVLKGSYIFISDLTRAIDLPLSVDFIGLSSYGEATEASGVVKITSDLTKPIENKHVLIVEDIVDTGLTLNYLFTTLRFRGAESVEVCTLLDRPYRRLIEIEPRYVGFTAPDAFVVGYGFDYRQRFRNLPDIRLLAR
jgi:hypoxanthine phosphoribosyltransferase